MNKIISIFIISLVFLSARSQENILFPKTSHDFGQIISMDFPPATFSFKNTGSKPLAIITTKSLYETKVQFQRVYIQPGETGMLYVKYETQKIGQFFDEILVYFNTMPDPIKISIKGEIISVADCFPDKTNMTLRKIHVIDIYTKEHIPGAQVHFLHNEMTEITETMNERGQKNINLPIGIYEIDIAAEGYKPSALQMFIQKSVPVIFLELEPLQKTIHQEEQPEIVELPKVTENSEQSQYIPDVPIIEDTTPVVAEEPMESESVTPEIKQEETPQPTSTTAAIELPRDLYTSNNIVFVIDRSLSMKSENKMIYLKKCMFDLVDVLRDIDLITIITYNNDAVVNAESIPGDKKTFLKQIIRELEPIGLTNGVKGLDLAYQYANKNFSSSGNNQLILATDGEFTGSTQSEDGLKRQIAAYKAKKIIMSIVGFGKDKEAISMLKKMSAVGGGHYLHILTMNDTVELLINEIKRNSAIIK